jgi:C4-dicarboxylate-specific signal transduction histidine kinase
VNETLDCLLSRAYARNDRAFIEVEDECGGLSPKTMEELFQPFKQQEGDRSGLGLGLSIAKRAVESNAGALSARTLPGKGCVFTINLLAMDIEQSGNENAKSAGTKMT